MPKFNEDAIRCFTLTLVAVMFERKDKGDE
jgi:hypothetical protein